MSAYRFLAYRATTKEPLHLDLPIDLDELGWTLSGAGTLKGTVAPDVGALRADDGGLLLEEWGTLIFAEADDEIRWGGILVSSDFEGEAWKIEAAGFAAYPSGMAYTGTYSKIGVDPAQIVADLWAHLQAQPDGDLDVVVTGDKTPVRLGTPKIPAIAQVYVDGAWRNRSDVDSSKIDASTTAPLQKGISKTATSFTTTTLAGYGSISVPFDVKIGAETITVRARSGLTFSNLIRGVGNTPITTHGTGTLVRFTGTATRTIEEVPAAPYVLAYYDGPDVGDEISSLAKSTPFDFTEHHRWDGDSIRHEIEIGYPRLGTRRDDLAFRQGDNVADVVTPSFDGDSFANYVIGLGAGEGAKSIHRTTAIRDGRLRRTAVYTAKDVRSNGRMDALIKDELNRRRDALQISSITVRNHPNAPIGSWQLGDDVLVEADLPWLGEVALWCRITGWALLSEDTARLTLARSDSFTYGG